MSEDPKYTPSAWEKIDGIRVLDPDGWRGENGRDWSDPISYGEWRRRISVSTCQKITRKIDVS